MRRPAHTIAVQRGLEALIARPRVFSQIGLMDPRWLIREQKDKDRARQWISRMREWRNRPRKEKKERSNAH